MSLLALCLVLASAILHVFWNTLVKQCGDKLSFAWLTTVAGSLVLLPPLLLWRLFSSGGSGMGPEAWLWAGVSGLLETAYVACLFGAYETAELSAVYPLSRGAAPVATLLLAGVLVGDWVTPGQAGAVGVLVAGTLLVGLSACPWKQGHVHLDDVRQGHICQDDVRQDSFCQAGLGQAGSCQDGQGQGSAAAGRPGVRGVLLALATGCAIAGYHLADRKAMGLVPVPDPLCYLFAMHLFMSLFVTAWAWRRRPGWAALASAWLDASWKSGRRDVLLVAVCTPLSYFLIVLALRQGNVVHVTAARNVGVLLSTLVGALLLHERVSRARALGSLLIVAGMAGLALLRG